MSEPPDEITRVKRSRSAARDWYDTISPWYRRLAGPFEHEPRSVGLDRLDIARGDHVIDIGCGPGSALVDIARQVGDEGWVVGLDIAHGMCRQARSAVRHADASDRSSVVCGDALELPFRAESFDAVFMSFTLELFDTPDIPAVLDECRRVLEPAGRLGVVALSKRDAGLATVIYERIHDVAPTYVDCRPIYVREAVEASGFQVAEATQHRRWGLPVEVVVARA